MPSLVPTRNRPQIQDMRDTAVDEYALLQRIAEGDTLAFEAFYKVYYSRLFRFILRMTHQPESIEELIQETLLVVWKKPEGFNHSSKIFTWVFGIANNTALKSMSRMPAVAVDLIETMGDPALNPAQNLESEDWLNCALAILHNRTSERSSI